MSEKNSNLLWVSIVAILIIAISTGHYSVSTTKWQYHLIFMESYFLPILIAAFQFGIKGGLGAAVAVSIIYFPHIMLQWGGLVETNLMRFMQIALFNVIGYVTGLKAQAEKEEKQRYHQTAKELVEMVDKLKEQSEQLAELEEQLRFADRLSIIGELTASLAHEVRNPLGAIRGAVEILSDELPGDTKNSEFFKVLIEETKRLNNVVENYLSLARRTRRQRITFDLIPVVQSVVQLMAASARRKQVKCSVHLQKSPVWIAGDANQLQQILINLCLNALQAMPGGGKLRIRLEPPSKSDQDEDTILLSIADTGIGIAPEQLNNIFKPFFTTKKEGTGLGLSIVKRLAKENGWQIQMSSKPNVGTTVSLIFPLASVPEEDKEGEIP